MKTQLRKIKTAIRRRNVHCAMPHPLTKRVVYSEN